MQDIGPPRKLTKAEKANALDQLRAAIDCLTSGGFDGMSGCGCGICSHIRGPLKSRLTRYIKAVGGLEAEDWRGHSPSLGYPLSEEGRDRRVALLRKTIRRINEGWSAPKRSR